MDHAFQMIQEFEHLAVHLFISLTTISALARWAWNEELKKWFVPKKTELPRKSIR